MILFHLSLLMYFLGFFILLNWFHLSFAHIYSDIVVANGWVGLNLEVCKCLIETSGSSSSIRIIYHVSKCLIETSCSSSCI